jgi:hypothetical protein
MKKEAQYSGEPSSLTFSQRMGYTPAALPIQIESMDDNLRVGLWNAFLSGYLDRLARDAHRPAMIRLMKLILSDILKRPLNTFEAKSFIHRFEQWFNKAEWYAVYDFIEWLGNQNRFGQAVIRDFKYYCNQVLERESSAYRFVDNLITPIIDKTQIQSIVAAREETVSMGLDGVNRHLENALVKLTNRTDPDYKNSVKESISAVEGLCQLIVGNRTATLSAALKTIDTKVRIHPALKEGFLHIYGYTSNEGGIRHADGFGEGECGQEDAIFMLVACSAFVSYLISKAQKAGINLQVGP